MLRATGAVLALHPLFLPPAQVDLILVVCLQSSYF